jgi:BirA family transcriptional regulator, biotin operon repressor / biotin---[acetyl-CoA-carboxylase] ligase
VIGAIVHRFDVVDSTQSALARLAKDGAPDGTVVTARHQTMGRGRRDRSWWDAAGESLLLSVLLRPAIAAAQVSQLSLVAAIAVTDAVATVAAVRASIRWPNDVLVDGAKLSGILPDAVCHADGRVQYAILGIGINVNQRAFPAGLAETATSLALVTGSPADPADLERAVLAALDARYGTWLAAGFEALRDAWRSRSCTLGSRVALPEGAHGIAVDVAPDGALLVDVGEGEPTRVVAGALATAG